MCRKAYKKLQMLSPLYKMSDNLPSISSSIKVILFKMCAFSIPYITKTRLFKYIEKISTKKTIFQLKKSDIFRIPAQNIDCGYSLEPPRRGGSNEYPQSMFLNRNKKIMYTPVNPCFII